MNWPQNFRVHHLWIDPLRPDPGSYYGAVLRAEEIKRYIEDHNLLINREDFTESNLKGASYTMSPHHDEGWRVNRKGVHEKLIKTRDENGLYYLVPRNSLVYIRLRETLRIPFYMIGRHNLKIDYVYQGLLLGTGPQVDPGYSGQIFIPLHNLTNQDVRIYIDRSFVSIDFVRTSPLDFGNGIHPLTLDEFYKQYNDSKRPIKREKFAERITLEAYLKGRTPSSSLGFWVKQFEKFSATIRHLRIVNIGILVAFFLAVMALFETGYVNLDGKLATKTEDSAKKLQDFQIELLKLRSETAAAKLELQNQLNKALDDQQKNSQSNSNVLQGIIKTNQTDLERLSKEIALLRSDLEATKQSLPQRVSKPKP